MLESDKKEFARITKATLKTYRVEPDADVLNIWWGVLSKFELNQVQEGFAKFVSSKDSKFPPVPAHIVEAIESLHSDGRPSADEAWAIAIGAMDEHKTVVLNDEIAEAYGIAQPIYSDGDEIGARMAFRAAYDRIVRDKKGQQPKWWPSLGYDVQGRIQPLLDAIEKKRLPSESTLKLLPPDAAIKYPQLQIKSPKVAL